MPRRRIGGQRPVIFEATWKIRIRNEEPPEGRRIRDSAIQSWFGVGRVEVAFKNGNAAERPPQKWRERFDQARWP